MTEAADNPVRPGVIRRLGKWVLVGVMSLFVAGITGWGALFLHFSNLPGAALRTALAVILVLATVAAFWFVKNKRWALLGCLGAFVVLLIWFFSIAPSNDRNWETDVATLSHATINGKLLTIHNIRNLDYRTETDFTPRYYDKTFNLDKLESVDLSFVYWGSPAIAHVITSFGFGGDDFVAFSIETRKEKGESYSTLAGFFRHYELMYIVADERDVIRVRTNYRNPREQVHIYRTRLPLENQRKLLLDFIKSLNELKEHPEWYNTLDDNCTTGVLRHTRAYPNRGRYNWKILLSGYAPEYVYEIGMVDTNMPYAELAQRCLVNARAEAAGDGPDFSRRIREGIPKPKPLTLKEFMPP